MKVFSLFDLQNSADSPIAKNNLLLNLKMRFFVITFNNLLLFLVVHLNRRGFMIFVKILKNFKSEEFFFYYWHFQQASKFLSNK